MSVALGLDIGGTFTDVVLLQADGRIHTAKVLNTPDDMADACIKGLLEVLAKAGLDGRAIGRVVHATTRATNEIIERRRPPVAFITTEGFIDLFTIAGADRRDLYDLAWERWSLPIAPHSSFEVPERIGAGNRVVRPLDPKDVETIGQALAADPPEAVAVCLLHSYASPQHERLIGDLLQKRFPDSFIALSSDIWPEHGEYNRAVATILSSYIGPVMRNYLASLEERLRQQGVTGFLQIMQSNGGTMSVEQTVRRPLFSIESGPAAGALAAGYIGGSTGHDHVIAFDMGGTTAKAAVLEDGKPALRNDFRVGGAASGSDTGVLVHLPVVDLAEVGAGGGSIAWIDPGGALQIGPRSAGASPGPACYGLGGGEPTVTDANLLLGYLSPSYFLGGAMPLRVDQAEEAVAGIAERMGCTPIEAAAAVYDIVNINMAQAVRLVTLARGQDPRDHVLLASGGAGPTHVARLAEAFGITKVLVPPVPGVFSTLGLLCSDAVHEDIKAVSIDHDTADPGQLTAIYEQLEVEQYAGLAGTGLDVSRVVVERSIDVRRPRQTHSLTVPVAAGPLDAGELDAIRDRYLDRYEQMYGIRREGPVVFQGCRVRLRVPSVVTLATAPAAPSSPAPEPKGTRQAFFRELGVQPDIPVYERTSLGVGWRHMGPVLVEEVESTTVVPPGWEASIDDHGNLVMTKD
ncbi:MAG: hydantoinase/oxoprolinase family protein [Acidimicrobiales bacterium]|nr:hydantoinase/oxoprolinase family protein [Acidimicrobiales bacterium]